MKLPCPCLKLLCNSIPFFVWPSCITMQWLSQSLYHMWYSLIFSESCCTSAQDLTLSPVTYWHSVRACPQDLTLLPASSTFSENMPLCLGSRPVSINLVYYLLFISITFSYWFFCFCIKMHYHHCPILCFPTVLLCILFTVSHCQLHIKLFNHLSIVGICLTMLFYCLL